MSLLPMRLRRTAAACALLGLVLAGCAGAPTRIHTLEASGPEGAAPAAWTGAPFRVDADLFRVRRVRVRLRLEADSDAVRGRDPARTVRAGWATSAAREASNGDLLVERAAREAGVHVEIIEGVEEARLVQMAVLERVTLKGRTALLIDIGGGSTELTLLRDKRPVFTQSLPVGTVRLIESFLEAKGPVSALQRRLLDEYVRRVSAEALREIK